MPKTQRDLTQAGLAARALNRSGLSVIRVPDDLPELARYGLLETGKSGLGALERLGLVRPIIRGLYEVRDPNGVSRSSFELILAAWFGGKPHLATGWWTLAEAGLSNQDIREVIVLTRTNRREITVSGRRIHPTTVSNDELWGGRIRDNGLIVARPERALCDCAGRRPARIPAPRLAEALDVLLASDRGAVKRLTTAVERFSSPAVARRLGYLVELIAGERAAEPLHALIGSSHKADALDPGDEKSPIITRWQVRTRLTPEELLEHRRVS